MNALAVVNRRILGLAMLAIVASWVLLTGTCHADGQVMMSVAILISAAPCLYLSNALPERRGHVRALGAAVDEFKFKQIVSAPVKPPPLLVGTPYDLARALQDLGASVEEMRARLVQQRLTPDEIETLLNAIQLRPNTRSKI